MYIDGKGSVFLTANTEGLTAEYGLIPFPSTTSDAKITWDKPDSTIIAVRLYYY
jgi:hypothetical protein